VPIATDGMRQVLANSYTGQAATGSLHTADPGTTGASEVTGGSPAYARKALSWTAGTTGTATASATFDVPASTTVTHGGIWNGDATPLFRDKTDITDQTFASQGTLKLDYTYTQT
jgi:hypothetical protein